MHLSGLRMTTGRFQVSLLCLTFGLLFVACSGPQTDNEKATSSTASLNGRVIDGAATGISGAFIELKGTGLSRNSSASGAFRFVELPAAEYVVEVSKIGFENARVVVELNAGAEERLDPIVLSPTGSGENPAPDDPPTGPKPDNPNPTEPGSGPPRLGGVEPVELLLDGLLGEIAGTRLRFENSGSGTLSYELERLSGPEIQFEPDSGRLAGGAETSISVTVACPTVAADGALLVRTNDPNAAETVIPFVVTCSEGSAGGDNGTDPDTGGSTPQEPEPKPELTGVPLGIQIDGELGGTGSGSLSFSNGGSAVLDWSLSSSLNLSFEPDHGELSAGASVQVSISGPCDAPTTGSITLSSNDPARPVTVIQAVMQCVPPVNDPEPAERFEIELEFSATVPEDYRQAVRLAATRWEEIISGGLTPSVIDADDCGGHPLRTGRSVTNLLISVRVEPLGGNSVGFAGPCSFRGAGGLPDYGYMTLSDSLSGSGSALLELSALHEMGHILGIGTLWNIPGIAGWNHINYAPENACSSNEPFTADPEYTSNSALSEYRNLPGRSAATGIPLEKGGPVGVRCGHWDADALPGELMVSEINATESYTISRITAASLNDLGYDVDLTKADQSYSPTSSTNY